MPTRKQIIEHEPWCTEHDEDAEDSYCHTETQEFGRPTKPSEFRSEPRAGTLQASRGTRDDEDYVWLEYLRAKPKAALLARLDRNAILALHEGLREDPEGLTQAIRVLAEAFDPELLPVIAGAKG